MAEMFRIQAAACQSLGSPFYGALINRAATDILSDGPTAAVLAGHEEDPGPSALALRLFGTVHRMVLDEEAPELAKHYPSAGGDGDAVAAWPVLRALFRERPLEISAALHQVPQTNEVGRAAGLFGALMHIAGPDPLPVRLNEIGAAAGLNLRADRFLYRSADGHRYGPLSPVELDPAFMTLPAPAVGPIHVVERRGVDVSPIDPHTRDGAIRLQSWVWPDQLDRLQRMRGAILVAGQYPAQIDTGAAADFLDRLEPVDGHLTVLWHSVMWQYLGPAERARISARLNQIGAMATDLAPFAHISYEPRKLTPHGVRRYLVTAETWPARQQLILGEGPGHGMPVTWGPPAPDLARPSADGPQWPG